MNFSYPSSRVVASWPRRGRVRLLSSGPGILRFLNLIQIVERSGRPFLLLLLDTEEAFDRVNWGYMRAVLTKFGFTGFIGDAIGALYSHPAARTLNSGIHGLLV